MLFQSTKQHEKKIIYVTSQSPFGNGEIWAIRELNSLIEMGVDVLIVPRTGHGKIIHQEAKKLVDRTIATPFVNISIIFSLLKKIIFEPFDFF